jgi:hypothetical protein
MTNVGGVSGTSGIHFEALANTIGTGDMESVLLAFGIERAQNMESAVKAKIADMRSRNADIQELQKAMQYLRSVKPEKDEKDKKLEVNGSAIKTSDPQYQAAKATLEKHGLWSNIKEDKGEAKLGKKDAFADIIANLESRIDELTSNDQLDMITLQSMVSKQNNAIEMVSNLTSKFAQLNDKIVGNMR